ncbi:TMEM175 family protein [Hymenobacter baengnokdamensis]|uniref:TMEM175 family protein n=1 Tax=Hymenobacter baengnokdamensis TaxID=2615203 RepID=UPI001246FC10|nr:TMEM175 family protein [Hymenobacter baengnokdamensis]
MQKGRLEAFSDGVLAIILTIMVLEIKVPHGDDFTALKPLLPICLSYVLSFLYVGIYWNSHHHLLSSARQVSGGVLWANLHLLFWLSLTPFATGWMGENHFAPATLAAYGVVLLGSGIAYFILQNCLIAVNGPASPLAHALGHDWKGKLSLVLYGVGIGSSFVLPWLAGATYVAVALMWLVPDPRIERVLQAHPEHEVQNQL